MHWGILTPLPRWLDIAVGAGSKYTERPTSEGGLTNVARNMQNEEEAIAYYRNIFGNTIAEKGLDNFIFWDIDPNGGFAPWRF